MATERWVLVGAGALDARRRVVLDRDESRHLATTLRLRRGDRVTACDGSGAVADATLEVVDPRGCELEIVARLPAAEPLRPAVTLALSVLHSQAMDWAVQKSVEVGVATLIPLLSERSQLSAKAAAGRRLHWQRVGLQALKQCRRPWRMDIQEPVSLERLLAERGGRPGLVAAVDGRDLRELAEPLPDLVLIGPEGGFSAAELEALRDAHWQTVRLGRWVLRAETAAVVGGATLIAALKRGGSRV